jgi:cytochrome d ubiquinol oxidase subunit I
MSAAVITGSFVMAAVGAFYLLSQKHIAYAKTFLRLGVIAGLIASCAQLFPTGDAQGRMVAGDQPATLAGMEGLFQTQRSAPILILGQPDVENQRLENPISVPGALSFLTYRRWSAEVRGLDSFPAEDRPDQIVLLYYSYHIMIGLGTIFIALLLFAAWQLWRGHLYDSKKMLWALMLVVPFPYIATTAGWITAEVGRQPWLVYGLMRTAAGVSPRVSSGSAWFTLLGFMGLYTVLGILFLFLIHREIEHGPESVEKSA